MIELLFWIGEIQTFGKLVGVSGHLAVAAILQTLGNGLQESLLLADRYYGGGAVLGFNAGETVLVQDTCRRYFRLTNLTVTTSSTVRFRPHHAGRLMFTHLELLIFQLIGHREVIL